ncbi:MAG: hypothetical protein ACLR3R_18720 [Clostridium paraputrificum]
MSSSEIQKLIDIENQWQNDFQSDLLEDIFIKHDKLSDVVIIMLNELIPSFIKDDYINKDLYLEYKTKFLSLNLKKLDEEYYNFNN